MNKQKDAEIAKEKIDKFLGYITVNAKFMLMSNKNGTLIVGGLFDKNLLSSKEDEMWVAEITIRPKYKFVGNKEGLSWKALTVDQRLASDWGNKDNWKRKGESSGLNK